MNEQSQVEFPGKQTPLYLVQNLLGSDFIIKKPIKVKGASSMEVRAGLWCSPYEFLSYNVFHWVEMFPIVGRRQLIDSGGKQNVTCPGKCKTWSLLKALPQFYRWNKLMEETQTSWAAGKRDSQTFQLQVVHRVPGSQLLSAVSHVGVGFSVMQLLLSHPCSCD